jgi:hypothetical protein
MKNYKFKIIQMETRMRTAGAALHKFNVAYPKEGRKCTLARSNNKIKQNK